MKRKFRFTMMVFVALFLLRGQLYRWTMCYNDIGDRATIKLIDTKLIKIIEAKTIGSKPIGFEEVIEIADQVTTTSLRFTFDNNASSNPNDLLTNGAANCLGYSALFNSIANYLIETNGLLGRISIQHKIGKLSFLGVDIHQFFDSPFFRDHDYNQIKDVDTGTLIFVDPTVSDYLWIKRVAAH